LFRQIYAFGLIFRIESKDKAKICPKAGIQLAIEDRVLNTAAFEAEGKQEKTNGCNTNIYVRMWNPEEDNQSLGPGKGYAARHHLYALGLGPGVASGYRRSLRRRLRLRAPQPLSRRLEAPRTGRRPNYIRGRIGDRITSASSVFSAVEARNAMKLPRDPTKNHPLASVCVLKR
jgi:hypothetical protein